MQLVETTERQPQENFRRMGPAARLFGKLKAAALSVVHGSLATKLSCCFMGVGQIMRKQYVKGILYALLEVLFILFMVFFGGSYMGKLLFSGHLGTVQETGTGLVSCRFTICFIKMNARVGVIRLSGRSARKDFLRIGC